jgi:hypothetical protein
VIGGAFNALLHDEDSSDDDDDCSAMPPPAVKCILHATVSEDSFFGVIDITDFYLGSPMPYPEFLKLYTQDYRPELLEELGITPYIQVDRTGIKKSILL